MIKVAQCWDDGVVTDFAVQEICRKYNAKATFNLCPAWIKEERVQPSWNRGKESRWSFRGFHGGRVCLKDLKEHYQGFQVASHCWSHENAGDNPDEVFIKAALDARNFLEDTFEQECRGFAWPCGKHTPSTEKLLKEAGFLYGRTVENALDVTDTDNPLALSSNCHFQSVNFWNLFEEAKKNSPVFYFWGHSYEMLDYDKLIEQYELKIRLLSEDPEVEWIDVKDIVPLCRKKSL